MKPGSMSLKKKLGYALFDLLRDDWFQIVFQFVVIYVLIRLG